MTARRASDRHIIARRWINGRDDRWRIFHAGWTIDEAREAYDAGKIELAQRRDGDEMVLYAIPRAVPAKRRPLFGRQPTPVPPHKVTLRGIA